MPLRVVSITFIYRDTNDVTKLIDKAKEIHAKEEGADEYELTQAV